jgi:hypothetical protein
MATTVTTKRDSSIRTYGAIVFAVLIALIGAFMMTLTSSPAMKGAAMLWIPAALQLIAGVWFGWWRGGLAGGIGAYAAGIFAYGGWGEVDIIMNLIAGGVANAALPAVLFKLLKINPDFGADAKNMMSAVIRTLVIFIIVLIVGISPLFISFEGKYMIYGLIGIVLLIGLPFMFWKIKINKLPLIGAVIICAVICAVSAFIGMYGVVRGGNTWEGAFYGTGIGWFLGDIVSCFLGLYMLACFTPRARKMGLCQC